MRKRSNNPRIFAETVAICAWRSPFEEKSGIADLHVDASFKSGVGVGGSDSLIKFKLSLRSAEIRIIEDKGGIIEVIRSTAIRNKGNVTTISTSKERKTDYSGEIDAKLSPSSIGGFLNTQAAKKTTLSEKTLSERSYSDLEFFPWPTDNGYAFIIKPLPGSDRLHGQPWHPAIPTLKLYDKNHKREKGEAPEVLIEIRCSREDLLIEDVSFQAKFLPHWSKISRRRQIAIEQYIKEKIDEAGLSALGTQSPFNKITIADAIPRIERWK